MTRQRFLREKTLNHKRQTDEPPPLAKRFYGKVSLLRCTHETLALYNSGMGKRHGGGAGAGVSLEKRPSGVLVKRRTTTTVLLE